MLLGEPTDTSTISLDDVRGWDCRVKSWRRRVPGGPAYESAQILNSVRMLVESYWKAGLRDDRAQILSFQYPTLHELANTSVARFVEDYGGVAVVFADLDNFKDVNDHLGMSKGDAVILQTSAILEECAGNNAIALHRSGDEFLLIHPSAHADETLHLLKRAMDQVASHDFDTSGISIGFGAGIATARRGGVHMSCKQIEKLAEKAVKLPSGDKLRGRARLHSPSLRRSVPDASNTSHAAARCVAKATPASERPFDSPWLNYFSQAAHQATFENNLDFAKIALCLADAFRWMQPDFASNVLRAALPHGAGSDWEPRLSPADLAYAAAHGLYRAGYSGVGAAFEGRTLQIRYGPHDHGCRLRLMPDEFDLLVIDEITEEAVSVDLGGFPRYAGPGEPDPDAARRALIVKIGHGDLPLPASMFCDVLTVDDRPTRGGLLPDFWESTVARLVSRVGANPNISSVYVLGDSDFAKDTVRRLKAVEQWSSEADYYSYKTGMEAQRIKEAAARLQGKIHFLTDNEELIPRFAEDLRPAIAVQPLRPRDDVKHGVRFLQRQLQMNRLALKVFDGCRMATIAEAFLVVLEIARKASPETIIRDQAGQELTELVDFRVNLSDPLTDRIPAFYRQEADSLKKYVHEAFLDESSFFGGPIGTTQIEAVVGHVAGAIKNADHRFATRRAILVVPHQVRTGEELAPLGLISVRIIPRFAGHRIVLHYSFTWRTVEALVGFPYSLYGSVGYAEHLTELVCAAVGSPQIAKQIDFGEVSYIAHSLHMFMDDYGQNIARRIVNDASL